MREHAVHAQRIGHAAGVLSAGAAEALQRVAGDVVTARHRDALDRVGHVLHRDLQEALGQRLGRGHGPAMTTAGMVGVAMRYQRLINGA